MIAVYLGILIAIIIYYILKPAPSKKQDCRVARAGDVEHMAPLVSKINDLSNKSFVFNGETVNIRDYETFVISGESMGECGIHTGNGVLVSRLFDKGGLKKGTIIIYEIDPGRYVHDHPNAVKPQYGFKIRQFIDYIDLSDTNESIYAVVKRGNADLDDEENKNMLFAKLDKARKYLNNQKVIVSVTYKDRRKDYSIHSFQELYGVVKYIIPEEYMKA